MFNHLRSGNHLNVNRPEYSVTTVEQLDQLINEVIASGSAGYSESFFESNLSPEMLQLLANWEHANQRMKQGATFSAISVYQDILAGHPDFIAARYNLARLYNSLGDQEAAIAHYKRCLEYAPHDSDSLNALADIYMTSENVGDALYYYSATLSVAPNRLGVWINLGTLYLQTGDLERSQTANEHAMAVIDSMLADSVENSDLTGERFLVSRNLGWLNYYRDEFRKAAEHWRLAMSIKPDPHILQMLKNIENMAVQQHGKAQSLFDLGQIMISEFAEDAFRKTGDAIDYYLQRHGTKDWGYERSANRAESHSRNNAALESGMPVQSVFYLSDGTEIWIVTDFYRGVSTTICLPYPVEMKDGRTMTTTSLTFTLRRSA